MKDVIFYNAVVNRDLFELVRFYCRYNEEHISNYDALTLDEWRALAKRAVEWTRTVLISKIVQSLNDSEYNEDGWTPLYYMMCAYAQEYLIGQPTMHRLSLDELRIVAEDTVKWLYMLADSIREVTDSDLETI